MTGTNRNKRKRSDSESPSEGMSDRDSTGEGGGVGEDGVEVEVEVEGDTPALYVDGFDPKPVGILRALEELCAQIKSDKKKVSQLNVAPTGTDGDGSLTISDQEKESIWELFSDEAIFKLKRHIPDLNYTAFQAIVQRELDNAKPNPWIKLSEDSVCFIPRYRPKCKTLGHFYPTLPLSSTYTAKPAELRLVTSEPDLIVLRT